MAAGSGLSQAPPEPKEDAPASGSGLTAASFMDSEAFAAQAEERRAKAAKARQSEAASAAAKERQSESTSAAVKAGLSESTPVVISERLAQSAGESPRPASAAERNAGGASGADEPAPLSPEALAACTEYFTHSAGVHGRAAKIWGLLACVGAAAFGYFFYYASLDLLSMAQAGASTGHDGLFFTDLLLTKMCLFLPWFCVILLCIRSCRIEREHQARILYRQVSLNLLAILGDGLDRNGRSTILTGIIAPDIPARR